MLPLERATIQPNPGAIAPFPLPKASRNPLADHCLLEIAHRPMAPVIRPARAKDIDALVAIENAAFVGDRISRRSFRTLIERATAQTLVVEDETAILGYCISFSARARAWRGSTPWPSRGLRRQGRWPGSCWRPRRMRPSIATVSYLRLEVLRTMPARSGSTRRSIFAHRTRERLLRGWCVSPALREDPARRRSGRDHCPVL